MKETLVGAASLNIHDLKTAISIIAFDFSSNLLKLKSDPIQNRLNAFDSITNVIVYNRPEAALLDLLTAKTAFAPSTFLLSASSILLPVAPLLSSAVNSNNPFVFHLEVKHNFDNLNILAGTGAVVLTSNSTQQASDLALLSQVISIKCCIPVIHAYKEYFLGFKKVIKPANNSVVSAFHLDEILKAKKDIESEGLVLDSHVNRDNHALANDLLHILEHAKKAEIVSPSCELFEYIGDEDATEILVTLGSIDHAVETYIKDNNYGLIKVGLYRPWLPELFLKCLPASVERIGVVTLTSSQSSSNPLYLDVVSTLHARQDSGFIFVKDVRLRLGSFGFTDDSLDNIFEALFSSRDVIIDIIQTEPQNEATVVAKKEASPTGLQLETPYLTVLERLFPGRLAIANLLPESSGSPSKSQPNAEFGLGVHLVALQKRQKFVESIHQLVNLDSTSVALKDALKGWLAVHDSALECNPLVAGIIESLEKTGMADALPLVTQVYENRNLFTKQALWIVGDDNLYYDINNSGVHHVMSSKKDVNMLVLDTQPYTEKIKLEASDNRKKDIGLYGMNYGGVYVASVAVHFSYNQVLKAMAEAEAFPGPSVVLAYAPRVTKSVTVKGSKLLVHDSLSALKETKLAIDSGYWPLYRWNPLVEHTEKVSPFTLDSERLKTEIAEFLDRENHLALLSTQHPEFSTKVTTSTSSELKKSVHKSVAISYEAVLGGNTDAKPIFVLWGSDGGNAEKLAKKFAGQAKARGFSTKVQKSMDDFGSVEELASSSMDSMICVFFVSTAGQGEFPTNSKEFCKSVISTPAGSDVYQGTRFSVFALGDSKYWPLKGDEHYFAKAGVDLDKGLANIGAARLSDFGVGDDQGADGFMTGYHEWVTKLWEALGVDHIEEAGTTAFIPTDDAIKIGSNFLRGTIAQGLVDTTTGALSEFDTKLTKFHGIYQQDDRDIREERLKLGQEKAFSFMIRVRVPGGISTPEQWIAMDDISDLYANSTIKLTTRQAFQFHGVVKSKLKKTIQAINQSLMDTIAACGDVNRNVMCSPNPTQTTLHAQVLEFSRALSTHLTPNTTAYHEIWLDKKIIRTTENLDTEPLYGKTYLPRKFKIAVAVPPTNDVDVFAHDLGFIAISEETESKTPKLIGFNVTVGGGMGMTHGNNKTYPRLADVMCFCTPDQAITIAEKVMLVQRDFGDRLNRKHARLKYTIEDRGIDWFRGEVQKRCGFSLLPVREFEFTRNTDRYGWTRGVDNFWHYGLYIQNGRVRDTEEYQLKTCLREIALIHTGDFRLTGNQSLIIGNIKSENRKLITSVLRKYEVIGRYGSLQLNSMACVALPTCALAMAESERYLPSLIDKIQTIFETHGLREDEVTIRMTGCANSCARPQIAEIAFIGKAPGTYNMYLGGGFNGQRLNKLYRENVNEEDILGLLDPVVENYSHYKLNGEHFGDFCVRFGVVGETRFGRDFHD